MNSIFPISAEKSPHVVMEALLRLKIKDAMTKHIVKAFRGDNFRKVQMMMKEKHISGVPVVEDERLIGIVSIDDVLTALDKGYIEENIEKYMTKKLIVLEEDMPLSFAISYFNKYRFRRFPVISRDKSLVGMLTSRDILAALVRELDKEISQLENKARIDNISVSNEIYREFIIKKFDFENAGKASFEIKKILKQEGFSQKIIRRAAVISYELEINIAIHSDGGMLIFVLADNKITIVAKDHGPGIAEVDKAMKEGFSTANDWIRSLGFGAGMGLPNSKRFSDEFDIQSKMGKGTTVKASINLEAASDIPDNGDKKKVE